MIESERPLPNIVMTCMDHVKMERTFFNEYCDGIDGPMVQKDQ